MLTLSDDDLDTNKNGKRGESISISALDDALTSVLSVCEMIDNGTNKGSLLAWVYRYIDEGKDIPASKVRDVIKDIYKEVAAAHAKMTIVRKKGIE